MSGVQTYLNGRVSVHGGDCREVLAGMEANSVDSVVCDPPYHLTSIVKRFGKAGSAPAKANGATGVYKRSSKGFMGKEWDGGAVAFEPETWAQVLRVLKPGGHMVAFSGTRTYHRMAVAIEDAGFEIRDMLAWLYGCGFPKSRDVSKDIDLLQGAKREVIGVRQAHDIRSGNLMEASQGKDRGMMEYAYTAPASEDAKRWQGWGSALKPALEPVVLARKPISSASIARNVLEHGTGALNIDACRIEAEIQGGWGGAAAGGNTWTEQNCGLAKSGEARPVDGRWPANVLHDGSDDVLAAFHAQNATADGEVYRFFYSAKASGADRVGSKHPTVKPVNLMQWLVRLITPPGGVVLDPFAGTGTTGAAAVREGFNAVLIEREEEYRGDMERRFLAMTGSGEGLFSKENVGDTA